MVRIGANNHRSVRAYSDETVPAEKLNQMLAAGKVTRMGVTERPKRFLRMGSDGTPILIHTLRAFLA